ncbi:MAG: hypothetical protein L6R38_009048 [Xanthoria sp. 2 TBL-2021]|nr:MAG: hypothetical protein L6R38_009048 [Xanthoria sp. 2 TBL-2021]
MNNTASSSDVADPSDWLKTTVPKLAPVESALRCQVCKDFFDTPMITSCSHTFCSLCIRRCLTNDGKCPVCRTADQELRLRRNWTVQEIVEAFQSARPSLSSLATPESNHSGVKLSGPKRKLDDTDLEEDTDEPTITIQRRKTRSQDKRLSDGAKHATTHSSDGEVQVEATANHDGNGSAACPICGQRMKEEAVFLHLDTHNEPEAASSPNLRKSGRAPSVEVIGTSRTNVKPPGRLPQLNYSLMKDAALRKKLSELGIPATGTRLLLIRRHAEWINIVNANADSSRPKSKREMLRELDIWDRTTGRSIASSGNELNNAGSIMRKDFDGAAWSANHSSDFQDLISKARNSGRAGSSLVKSGSPAQVILEQENHEPTASPQLTDSLPERPTSRTIPDSDDN